MTPTKEQIEAASKAYAANYPLPVITAQNLYEIMENSFLACAEWLASQSLWVDVRDRLPEPSTVFPQKAVYVLIHLDYSKWGRNTQSIEKASVHYSESQPYGGPNSLTGRGIIKGIYFAIPAICNPEAVTHWMPLPSPPTP